MQFYKVRTKADQPVKGQLIVPVGWRVFVNASTDLREAIVTINADGKAAPNNLVDGDEVEILSWRPKMPDGTRYQIRRLSDRREWWIAALFLRKTPKRLA